MSVVLINRPLESFFLVISPHSSGMLSLSNVSAWIEVDGKELEQYGIEEDSDRSLVTCWIASQAGKVE